MSRILVLLVAAFLASTALGWTMMPTNPDVKVADAACSIAGNCGMDPTKTAALTVNHQTTGGDPVLSDVGETWVLTATWSSDVFAPLGCTCQDMFTATATAAVTYSSMTGWAVNCTGCGAFIQNLGICQSGQGCDNAAGDLGYTLTADILTLRVNTTCNMTPTNAYLQKVVFRSTVVDDGITVDDTDCSAGSAVSPTSQTWSATDTGGFECAFSCSTNMGASVTILYN